MGGGGGGWTGGSSGGGGSCKFGADCKIFKWCSIQKRFKRGFVQFLPRPAGLSGASKDTTILQSLFIEALHPKMATAKSGVPHKHYSEVLVIFRLLS